MTLPIPFPIYGYTKDSNGEIIEGLEITISGQTSATVVSDANGKYLYDIQNLTNAGDIISIYAKHLGEHAAISWTVSLTPPSKRIDVVLQDSISTGEKIINTYHTIGNEAYAFTSLDVDSSLKISDLDWDE